MADIDNKDELLKLFEETERSYLRRIIDMIKGFKAPKDSLERKKAMIELQRLGAPIAAIAIVGLAILAMLVVKFQPPEKVAKFETKVIEEVPPEELEEEPPEPPEEMPELEEPVEVDVEIDIEAPPTTSVEQSPQPAPFDSVLETPSLVKINVPTSRNPGVRGEKLGSLKGVRSEQYVVGFLRFLALRQDKNTGLWDKSTGTSAIALLCFLAHGEVPGMSETGEFDDVVRRAIEGLLKDQITDKSQCQKQKGGNKPEGYHDMRDDQVGYFRHRCKTNYDQMVAVYALAEAYAMTNIPEVKQAVLLALPPILDGQTPNGGWYYNFFPKYPGKDQEDSSFTSWAVQALKAAKLAKIHVPGPDGRDRVVEALKKSTKGIRQVMNQDGSFGYVNTRKNQYPGLTAACALILQMLDQADHPDCKKALTYMNGWEPAFEKDHMPTGAGSGAKKQAGNSPQYYCYYLSQVRYNQGEKSKAWNDWHVKQQRLYTAAAINIPAEESGYKDHNGKPQYITYWGLAEGATTFGGKKMSDKDRLMKDKATKDGKRNGIPVEKLLNVDMASHSSWINQDGDGDNRVLGGCFTALQLMAYYRYSPLAKGALTKIEEEVKVQVQDEGGVEIEGLGDL